MKLQYSVDVAMSTLLMNQLHAMSSSGTSRNKKAYHSSHFVLDVHFIPPTCFY